jgi:serine/threonine protein phosphatase PrpC
MKAVFTTHRGAARRENQDALAVCGVVKTGCMDSREIIAINSFPALAAVIDGMGGYNGGERAAAILARTFSDAAARNIFPTEPEPARDEKILASLLEEAASAMRAAAREDPELSSMGAASAGILIRERSAVAFNCGDCRVYRFSYGALERLSRDHSVVQILFESGELDEDGMRSHPRKNIVTSAVTANLAERPEIFVKTVSRVPSDEFFICSDGVWEALSKTRIEEILRNGFPDAADHLRAALLEAACRDNISFIWLADEN